MQDPRLQLVDASGTPVGENNNWRDSQRAEIEETQVPPGDDREAAIVAALPSGNYTAVVRGNGNTTGVALVEVYTLN